MGWFLSRKDKRKSRRSARRGGTAEPFNPQRILWFVRAMTVLGAMALVFACWQWGEYLLSTRVGASQAMRVAPKNVELAGAPSWMSPLLKDEIRLLVAEPIDADPLNPYSMERAALALASSPWVATIQRVRREPGGKVVVKATYRRPAAIIEWRDGYRLVDDRGIRLPGLYTGRQANQINIPLITGVTSSPSAPGDLWPGEDIQAGIRLVNLLRNERFAAQIRAYDVSGRDERNRLRLALQTYNGGLVRWGLPPGQEKSLEPDTRTKLQWLSAVHRQRGQIDAGGHVVDLYGPAVFVHQAMAGETPQEIGYTW